MTAPVALAVTAAVLTAGLAHSTYGVISTVAGTGVAGSNGDGGSALAAQINTPEGATIGPDGDLYIADTSANKIRRVDSATGVISTFAGSGARGNTGDGGAATAGRLDAPIGIAVDAAGNGYIADSGNNRIRKVTAATGNISNFAGSSAGTAGYTGFGTAATAATLKTPKGVAVAADGSVLIADTDNGAVRRVDGSGTITTIAGTGTPGFSGDGGAATSAQLTSPWSVTPIPSGGFYISDTGSQRVRRVTAGGTISTIAGNGTAGFAGDGGQATSAQLSSPVGVAVGGGGVLYIADTANHRVRRLDTATGIITTAVGTGAQASTGDGGSASAAAVNYPMGITASTTGLYVPEGGGARVRFVEGFSAGPVAPTVSAVTPASPANDNAPKITGTAPAGTTVRLYTNSTCTSAIAASGTAADFGAGGIAVSVANDSSTTFWADATDGTASGCSTTSVTYVEDSTAPAAPTFTGGPSGPTNDDTPSWTFTTSGGTIECRVLEGATPLTGWAACSSPYAPTLTAAQDGAFTAEIRARDTAGNAGTATRTITLDRAAPAAPSITVNPGASTNDITPTWEWTAEGSGSTVQCRLDKGATLISDWAACSSPRTYDLSGRGDGDFTFSVRVTDAAGNGPTTTTSTVTLDTAAPAAPSITGTPGSDGSDDTPTWTFGDVAGTTIECQISLGATVVEAWAGCAATKTYTLTQDGTYTFAVRARDAAGNSSASTSTYHLDTVTPATPTITSSPASTGSNASPSWSFTGDGTGTYECRVANAPDDPTAWVTCGSPHIASLGARPDATYTFYVRARDAAQNVSGIATGGTYTLDRDPPVAPILTSAPGATTNDTTPTWEFTAAGTTGTQCRIDKGATVIAGWGSCVSPKTYDLAGRGDGEYTFSVRGLDGASNEGAITTDVFTLDTAAPSAPSFTAAPAAESADETPTWSFGAVSGATLTCRLMKGTTEIDPWGPCAATYTYDLSAEDDGTYALSVRATDTAGNVATATSSYKLDTTAPAPPAIGTEPPATGSAAGPSWSFTGESGVTFVCSLTKGGSTVSAATLCTSPRAYALASETDGTFTFAVHAKDAAGNVSSDTTRTYALDRAAPAAPSFTASPPAADDDPSPSWSFSTEASTTVECRLARGSTVISDWGTCTSPHVPDLSASDGDYTLRLRAKDAAGNLSTETVGSYKLDRIAPNAPAITGAPVPVGAGTSPSWQFSGEALASFECRLITGATVISDWASCTSPRSYNLATADDALYTFAVRAKDTAGNTGTATTGTYRLDREAPKVDAAPPAAGNSLKPSWTFSAVNATSLQCRLDRGAEQIEDWATCTSPKEWDLSGKAEGTYTFSVRAIDAGGQASAVVTGSYLLDTTAPGTPRFGDAPAGVGTGTSPRWTWTGDAGATFECRIERDGTADGPWAACASPRALDLAARADGRYTLSVRAVDAVGNRGTAATGAYILDRAAPPAPSFVTSPSAAGNAASAAWGFASEPGVAYECQLERDGAVVEAFVACASPRGYDLGQLPDGAYALTVRVTDGAGNASTSRSAPYVLDRQGPDGVKLLETPGAIGNDRTPTWAFSLEGATAFECTLRFGAEDLIATGPCSGPQTYELATGKDGTYVFRVRGMDAVGNPGGELEDPYVLDTEEPDAPEIETDEEREGADPSPAWRFTAEAGAVLECTLKRGDDVVAKMDECASPKDYSLADRGEGKYTFGVRATDAAGNTGELATATYQYEKAAVRKAKETPRTEPAPAATTPAAAPAPAATAPAPADEPTLTAEERSERREKAAKAKAQARKRAAAAARRRAAAQRAAQVARTSAPAPKAKKKRKSAKKKAAEQLAEVGKVMAKAATVAAEKTAFPVLLLGLCGLFLVAQDRVDRRDPKLAQAPIFADPEMPFVPRSELSADEEEQEPDS